MFIARGPDSDDRKNDDHDSKQGGQLSNVTV
jgi:hypothetical protein